MDHSTGRQSSDHENNRAFRLGAHLVLILSAAIGISALIAFTLFLFTGPWKILVLYMDTRAVLAFDLCLSMAFFAQHSGMIRQSFQAWFGRIAPEYFHGATFSIASGICLYCVIVFWQTSELTLVTASGTLRTGMRAMFLAALGGIIWSNLVLHSFDIFGLRAIRCQLRGMAQPAAAFTERGPYRWVRHPQYFCILVMIWSQPDLTADRLLFNVLWSTWITVGTILEERDLTATIGQQYQEYQSRVPMLIPSRIPR
jgi:protein-S-isoprenylcysteine O-methyltransferase Ste14